MTTRQQLIEVNEVLGDDPTAQVCDVFEGWSVEDYGAVLLSDLSQFPNIASRLPRMPSPEVQRKYTWWDGAKLMEQSVGFTHTLHRLYEQWGQASLRDATMLDYGAGWGRLTRMMLLFVPDHQLHACDAVPAAVDLYDSLGFSTGCDLVDVVPGSLPYSDGSMDLVWLFSVLTHLPLNGADAVMKAVWPIVRPGGIVVATVRSADFWHRNALVQGRVEPDEMVERHVRDGFAHAPHATAENWGDTSMSVDFATLRWPEWRVVATEDNWSHMVKVVFQRPLP